MKWDQHDIMPYLDTLYLTDNYKVYDCNIIFMVCYKKLYEIYLEY